MDGEAIGYTSEVLTYDIVCYKNMCAQRATKILLAVMRLNY